MASSSIRHQAKKCLIYVTAAPEYEQLLLNRVKEVKFHDLCHALVVPLLTASGDHRQYFKDEDLPLRTYHTSRKGKEPADRSAGGTYIKGDPAYERSQNENYEYCVVLEFRNKPQIRGVWGLELFNGQDLKGRRVSGCTKSDTISDTDVVGHMISPRAVQFGHPTLFKVAIQLLVRSKFKTEADESDVRDCITAHYSICQRTPSSIGDLLKSWREDVGLPPNHARLQPERCSPPFRAEGDGMHPFIRPYKQEWLEAEERILTADPKRVFTRMKPLVLIGSGDLGNTHRCQSLGYHIYMHKAINRALLHDCLSDGEAQYILFDDVEWNTLLDETGGGPGIINQAKFTWHHGSRPIITEQTLPVIIISNRLPGPNAKCWEARGWEYWKKGMTIITLDDRMLFAPVEQDGAEVNVLAARSVGEGKE